MSIFKNVDYNNGCVINTSVIKKFKTVTIKVYIIRELDKMATMTALLAKVLQRGTANFKTTRDIEQELERIYGSRLKGRARKIGEKHMLEFALHMPCQKYLNNEIDIYTDGLKLFKEILLNPYLENGSFCDEYVNQEKNILKQEIESVYNDKEDWALKRCIEISCEGEPFSIPSYGVLNDLDNINSESLYKFYKDIIINSNVQIFVVGDIDEENMIKTIDKNLIWNKKTSEIKPYIKNEKLPKQEKLVIEEDNVNQGKLVMSLRTKVDPCHELLPALLMFNNILGGGSHSKLFTAVREKHSLAYYASSQTVRNKQMLFIEAGIEPSKFEQTKKIIKEQLADMVKGSISDTELDRARTALVNSLWALQDYSGGNIDYYLVGLLTGCSYSTEQMEKQISRVTKDDVIRVARQTAIDTIYFLTSTKEAN